MSHGPSRACTQILTNCILSCRYVDCRYAVYSSPMNDCVSQRNVDCSYALGMSLRHVGRAVLLVCTTCSGSPRTPHCCFVLQCSRHASNKMHVFVFLKSRPRAPTRTSFATLLRRNARFRSGPGHRPGVMPCIVSRALFSVFATRL